MGPGIAPNGLHRGAMGMVGALSQFAGRLDSSSGDLTRKFQAPPFTLVAFVIQSPTSPLAFHLFTELPLNMKKLKKKSKGASDGVLIGNDERIQFVDIAGRTENAASIDNFIGEMEPFWRALEVNCVSECCGIDAHSFLPQDIWNAVRSCRDVTLKSKLASLRQYVDGLQADCVRSAILNQYFDRTMFLQLLDHVIATVNLMGSQRS